MKPNITLGINKPCSEKFENFKATQAGGFCGSCQKEVIDFTQMTDKEIIAYFQNNQKKTCGRFNESQLKTYSTLIPSKRTYSLKKIGIGLMSFSLLSLLTISKSQAQQTNPTVITEASEKKENSNEEINSTTDKTITITGNVSCPEYGALPGATVQLKGTNRGTTTDLEGNFSITVPSSDYDNILVIRFVGYVTQEITITKNTSLNLTFQLHEEYDLMGEVSVNEVYQSKQTVWQKFKGLFR